MAAPPTQAQSEAQAQRTAEARAAFTASLNSVGSNLDTELQARAKNLHANAAALSKQEASVEKQTKELAKQNDQMQKLVNQTADGLKDFGDLQNWAEMMERDLLILEETLRLVEDEKAGEKERHEEERTERPESGSSS